MVEKPTAQMESIAQKIRRRLDAKHQAREKVLALSREAIFNCANAIRAAHRGEFDRSRELLAAIRALLHKVDRALVGQADLRAAGLVYDAQKEFAEASATLALVTGQPVPDPDSLGGSYAAYLNGLGEAVGEMRRHLLDTLRQGRVERGEEILSLMDDLYNFLVTMDYPEALTGGLKHTLDMVRGVLERSRGDLTVATLQRSMEQRLQAFEERMGKG